MLVTGRRQGHAARWGIWALAMLVASGLVLEVCVRAYFVGSRAFSPRLMGSFRPIGHSRFLRRAADEGVCFELTPGAAGDHHFARLEINSHGMRDRVYPLKKPPGTYRIALLGDSFTMGTGVAVEEIYAELLERDLDAGVPVEVLNFGVAGYDLGHELAVLQTKVMAYTPDLVLIGFVMNDIQRHPACTFTPRHSPMFYSYLYNLGYAIWGHVTQPKGNLRHSDGEPEAWADVEEQLAGLAAYSTQTGTPVALVLLPYMEDLDGDYAYARLHERTAKLAAEYGIEVLDLLPAFLGHDARAFWSCRMDHHPNAAAHRLFADLIGFWLRERFLAGASKGR